MTAFDLDTISASVLGDANPGVTISIRHNLALLRAINWGAREITSSDLEFDPRRDWWHRPERRFAVAFLSNTWKDWPRDASKHPIIEEFCVALCTALDGLRERGEIEFEGVDYRQKPERVKVLAPVRALLEGFEHPGWVRCRPRKYADSSASEALLRFLDGIEADDFSDHERSLQDLMRWWGALGARSRDELAVRQRFFWAYRLLLCSPNAYASAGAQYFGPAIGNTEVSRFRAVVRRWREGVSLAEAPLRTLTRGTMELADRSHTNIVRELWGFLNLERGPFYNGQAQEYLEGGQDPMEATEQVGAQVRAWLDTNPTREAELAEAFERWLARAQRAGKRPLASARRYERRFDAQGNAVETGAPFDEELNRELIEQGSAYLLERYSKRERAAVMVHLALDAKLRPYGNTASDIDDGDDGDEGLGADVATDDPASRLRAANEVWIYEPWNRFGENRANKVARIHWKGLGDLRSYASKPDLFAKLEQLRGPGERAPINDANTVWAFGHDAQVGDVILVRKGLRSIIAAGEVTRPYTHSNENGEDHHCLGVDWFWTGTLSLSKNMAAPTFVRGTHRKKLLARLAAQMQGDTGGTEQHPLDGAATPYNIEDALKELFFTRAEIDKWRRLLERRRNLVLSGPPGVGKTFVAKRLAQLVIGEKNDESIKIVQFHQAYTYEQFVLGYRPSADAGTQFELVKGPLFQLAEQANANRDAKFVLIIDEINRGNISRILGEALMLLEADKRSPEWGLKLAYALGDSLDFNEGQFYLPPNLYVIGTMNTADRSLAVVDYALRRRFAFVDVTPRVDSPEFAAHVRERELPNSVLDRLREQVQQLNDRIEQDRALGRGFAIGHSFFTAGDGPAPWVASEGESGDPEALAHAWLDDVFEYEIEPLLGEYWAEDPDQLSAARAILQKGRP